MNRWRVPRSLGSSLPRVGKSQQEEELVLIATSVAEGRKNTAERKEGRKEERKGRRKREIKHEETRKAEGMKK